MRLVRRGPATKQPQWRPQGPQKGCETMAASLPAPARFEIHTHSTCSDGHLSVTELVALCVATGVGTWALTDHDTCRGCREAAPLARAQGIAFVPGIEISAYHKGSIHVLGYGFDPEHSAMRAYEKRMADSRVERLQDMILRLNALGVTVTMEDAMAQASHGGILGRPHLARALVARGDVHEPQQAFDRWLGEGREAYVAMTWLSVPEAISLIHEARGVAVLAHPGRYMDRVLMEEWTEAGLDGVEVRHPSHNIHHETLLLKLAERLGLLRTASSDFHGPPAGLLAEETFGRVFFPPAWSEPWLERLRLASPPAH